MDVPVKAQRKNTKHTLWADHRFMGHSSMHWLRAWNTGTRGRKKSSIQTHMPDGALITLIYKLEHQRRVHALALIHTNRYHIRV